MINDQKSFELLCHAVLEGKASEVELDQFRQLLRQDPAARKAYEQQVRIHALLTWQQGGPPSLRRLCWLPLSFKPNPM